MDIDPIHIFYKYILYNPIALYLIRVNNEAKL